MILPISESLAFISGRRERDVRLVVLLAAGCGLWLMSHRYYGIWHDARIYTLMAARWLEPATFARDVWFEFGSQDRFSMFSAVYGAAIQFLGIEAAARVMTLAGGAAYIAASWHLAWAVRVGSLAAMVFLILVSVPLPYAPDSASILVISESFVSARTLAFALSFSAVAAMLAGGVVLPWLLGIAALFIHPLVGIWAIVLLACVRLSDRVVAAAWFAAFLALGALMSAGIESGPLARLNGEFALTVSQTARIVFLDTAFHDPTIPLASLLITLMGGRYGSAHLRRWYMLAALVGASGYLVSLLAGALAPVKLVMEIQTWRALWLPLVFAVVAVVDLFGRYRHASKAGRLALQAGGASLVFLNAGGVFALGLLTASVMLFGRDIARRIEMMPPAIDGTLRWTMPAIGVIASIHYVLVVAGFGSASFYPRPIWLANDFGYGLVQSGGFGLLAAMLWLVWQRMWLPASVAVAFAICVAGASVWDARPERTRSIESRFTRTGHATMFGGVIRPGDVVYWQGMPERVWWEIGAASYASSVQAIGVVFSEPLAAELLRRLRRVALAGESAALLRADNLSEVDKVNYVFAQVGMRNPYNLHGYERSGLSLAGLEYLCADPKLDWVIHSAVYRNLAAAVDLGAPLARPGAELALYDCRNIRLAGGA